MKKIIFTVLLASGGILAGAQDLKDIKTYVTLQQYPKAKEAIDKFLSNESNAKKAEAWYYKAFVYNILARDEKVTPATAGRAMIGESYSALKKYRELDPKTPLTNEEQNSTVFNLYYGYYDLGVKAYNAKNFEESYSDFKGALDVHDFIYSNNFVGPNALKFNAMDTDVVWNLVILGTEIKKNDELITYYGKIAEAGLTEPRFLQAYEGLVLHYKDKKDLANFNKYLEKGRQLYPKEEFWEAVEIENATDGLSNKDLFAKYEEMVAKYPNSYVTFFNYAVELNKYVNAEENRNLPDIELYRKKEPEIIKKAIAIHSTPEANMLMASFYYNNSFDLTEAAGKVKGVKPDDVKKKNEFIAASKQALNDCIPYAETAIDLFSKLPKLKAMEKANYRQAYDMLIEVYRAKGDAAKSAAYKAKKEAIQ